MMLRMLFGEFLEFLTLRKTILRRDTATTAMGTLFVLDWQWFVEETRAQQTGIVLD